MSDGITRIEVGPPRGSADVAVIVMLRNEAPTVPLVLDSLARQQTEHNVELVWVDGASTDNTVEVIQQHQLSQRYPTTILIQPPDNCGMTVAQNLGARNTDAPILLFAQADVRLVDTLAIDKTLAPLQQEEVVGTRFVGLGPRDHFSKYDFWGQVFNARFRTMRVEGDFDLKWNAVRRDIFLELGGFDDEKLPLGGNDFEFETRLITKGRIASTDVEVEHLHGFGKRHRPLGLLRKYCRNAEVTGATTLVYLRNSHLHKGAWLRSVQHGVLVALCTAAFFIPAWKMTLPALVAAGTWHQRDAYKHIRSWRLVCLPIFSVAVLYAFSVFYIAGLIRGRTAYEFDNKMS